MIKNTSPISVSVVTNDQGLLTKRISLENAVLTKDASACYLNKGTVERVTLTDEPLTALSNLLAHIDTNQALIHGCFKGEHEKMPILSRALYDALPDAEKHNAITRTKHDGAFYYPDGPGTFFFDYDYCKYGGDPLDREKYWKAMCSVWPALKNAGYLWRPSTSACILNQDTKKLVSDSSNQRLYLVAKNASDLPRFSNVLFKRLWLAGYGYIFITKDGKMLPPTIFDTAVFSPERLDFCAGAECKAPLTQKLPPPMVIEGGLVDTESLPDLSAQEESKYAQLVESAKQRANHRAEEVRSQYQEVEIRRLVENGVSRHHARGVVVSRMSFDLLGGDILHFDSLGVITVNQVMSNLSKYEGATLADPIEPDYGKGKAMLFAGTSGGNPRINSFAHGGRTFTLWHGIDSLKSALKNAADCNSQYVDMFLSSKLNPGEEETAIRLVKEITGISMGAIRAALKAARNSVSGIDSPAELSHNDMAQTWLKEQPFPTPVGAEGSLWVYQEGCWEKMELTKLEPIIASRFNDQSRCARKSDYRHIAQHIYDIAEQPDFFEKAPIGVACPSGFFVVTEDGELQQEDLSANHRQRYRLPVDPVKKTPKRWLKFLEDCFINRYDMLELPLPHGAVYDEAGQIRLLQEIMGSIILGILYLYEKAVFLYGSGGTGKSTLLRIIEALIPEAYRTASDPFSWGKEYFIADLAGKRLNSVGELPDDKPIPASEFKRVTGRDTLQGRHPTHRPFTFKCTAAHLFNSNHLINTRDQSNGFWRRWFILGFFNVRQDKCTIKDLDQQIINEELGQIIYWALMGAIRLKETGGFTETSVQKHLMARWKTHTDSVAEFIADRLIISQNANSFIKRSDLYIAYTRWCEENGRKALSKQKFIERMTSQGIQLSTKDGYAVFRGVEFVHPTEPEGASPFN